MNPRNRKPIFAATAVAALVGAGGGAALYAGLADPSTKTVVREVTVASAQPTANTTTLSVNQIYKRAYQGVVELTVSSTQQSQFGGPQSGQAQGSGFVYDGQGHVVTNAHVIDGASTISVRFWNGATYDAQVVGSDPSTDLAVLKVDAPSSVLHPLTLGDSTRLAVGDGVVAIGSPFGLEDTVTTGIVSALHRKINSPNNYPINDSIQTDAAINHGNSGGPLLNAQGQVIGVNAQIESDSGGNDGVGFAIPSSTVHSIVGQLLGSGKVEHAYLGVSVQSIPASVAGQLGLPAGAEIAEVKSGTPAADAGLHGATGSRVVAGQSYSTGGDVVTAIDGKTITSGDALRAAIEAKSPGNSMSLTYVRDGKSHTVAVKLANRPS